MKAYVDKDTCISCGLCPSTCPDVFHFDSDDKAEAIEDDIPENLIDDAQEARDGCPVSAISIDES